MVDNTIQIVIKATDNASKVLGDVGVSAQKLGKTLSDVGSKLTLGVTVPLAAAGAASIKLASDYEESLNKVKVVFGEASKSIEDFSQDAAKNLGLSRQEALAAAGTFGNLFTAMGITAGESADMSKSIITLASDLASFNNINPTEALDKLRAGLVGEAEPLRSLGVNINQATIEAKAMELGLISAGQELTAAAKAQASYALILEQTSAAQGDFARTSDGLANSTRTLQAQLKDAGAQLGENLLPIALKLVQGLNSLVEAFINLPQPVQTGIIAIAGVAAAAGPLLSAIGGIISAFTTISGLFASGGALAGAATAISGAASALSGALIPALVAAAAPIAALAAAVGALIVVWNIFGEDAKKTVSTLGKIFGALPTLVKMSFASAGQDIAEFATSTKEYFTAVIEDGDTLNDWLTHFPESIRPAMQSAGEAVVSFQESFRGMQSSISDALVGATRAVISWNLVEAFQNKFNQVMDIARNFARMAIQFMIDVGRQIYDAISGAVSAAQDALSSATGGIIPPSSGATSPTESTGGVGSFVDDLFDSLFSSTAINPAQNVSAPIASTAAVNGTSQQFGQAQTTNLTVNLGNQTLGSFVVDQVNQAVSVG